VTSWLGLDVRDLLALVSVVDEGTMSAAGARLGYTQSAMSQRIRALERLVGAELFERPGGPRPLRLTAEGAALVGHARAVLARLDDAEAELRALSGGEAGVLRVGIVQSIGARVLPELVRRFRPQRPRVEIRLRESLTASELCTRMNDRELDVALMALPDPVPDVPFDIQVIHHDPIVLVAPSDSREAARSTISIEEVARLPLINSGTSCGRASLARRFPATCPPPEYVFESDDNSTTQALVGVGEAYWCDGLLNVDLSDPATTVVNLDPPVEPRRIAALWPNWHRPPAMVPTLIETAAAVFAALPDPPSRTTNPAPGGG
jgi:DNA-binding transcriptional LysR family regulator